jgi:hypothetical protein
MFTVKYQIADYAGTVTVNADENTDTETVIALAKKRLRQKAGDFPLGYQSWRVVKNSEESR